MKLLFDVFTSQGHGSVKFHGGGTYGQNLLIELLINRREDLDITVIMGEGKTNSNLKTVLEDFKPNIIVVNSDKDIISEILTNKYDVFYTAMPYYLQKYKDLLKSCSTRILGTIHGLREIELSYDSSYRSYLRNPIAKLKQLNKYCFPVKRLRKEVNFYKEIIDIIDGNILTVSNHTKHQILNVFPSIKPEQILVLNPIDKSSSDDEMLDISKFSLTKDKYFLLTSCDRPVKNSFRALAAFSKFKINKSEQYKICCIGFRKHQIKIIKKKYKNINDRLVFLNYVERNELEALMENAFCFIYPSISEGFGYPPLESMRNSVPVLASSHTAITEVCGDAVLYYNPFSEREIANRISQILNTEGLTEKLITLGHKRYETYSKNIGIQIVEIIDFICKK